MEISESNNNPKFDTLEFVSSSAVAKLIAGELAWTRLGPSQTHDTSPWKGPEVIQATVKILRALDNAGYEIVPKACPDEPASETATIS